MVSSPILVGTDVVPVSRLSMRSIIGITWAIVAVLSEEKKTVACLYI